MNLRSMFKLIGKYNNLIRIIPLTKKTSRFASGRFHLYNCSKTQISCRRQGIHHGYPENMQFHLPVILCLLFAGGSALLHLHQQ
jgi:hypothetical protein